MICSAARARFTIVAMRVVLAAVFGFAVSIGAAAVLYPGGTAFARDTQGYSFWDNYWCDLLAPVALNGEPNLWSSRLSRLSFACFAVALLRFWPMARKLFGHAAGARIAPRLGQAGALGLVLAAVFPSTTMPLSHGFAVVLAVVGSVSAALLISFAQRARGEHMGAALGLLSAVLALFSLAVYVHQGLFGGNAPYLPMLQKSTTFSCFAWMARVLWLAHRDERAEPPAVAVPTP